MLKNLSTVIFILISFLSVAKLSPIHAEILINEVSPSSDTEWVELYNTSAEAVDLTSWTLSDSSQPSASISGTITGNSYYVFERSEGWLNNSGGDTVTLKDNNGVVKDTISYGSGGIVTGIPNADKSIARIPNGSSSWQNNIPWTKGSQNLAPSNSPTPTNTPEPTNTPKPTNTPVPTITPTRIPTLTRTPTPKKSVTPTPEDTEEPTPVIPDSSTPTPAPQDQTGGPNPTLPLIISLSLVGLGLGLLSLVFVWKKRNAMTVVTKSVEPITSDILDK